MLSLTRRDLAEERFEVWQALKPAWAKSLATLIRVDSGRIVFFQEIMGSAFSVAGRQTLPDQFDGLESSVQSCWWSNQYDSITLEFDVADQVLIDIVLNR